QKQDQARLTKHKMLDYVACWYYKAAEYIQNTDIRVAFVSTSSITQGEQVGPLWTDMLEKYNLHIDFCHRSFPWDQESEETISYRERQLELSFTRKQGAQKQKKEKKQERTKKATVTCVIIGFSQTKNHKEKIIFTYIKKPIHNIENNKKYETIVTKKIVNNINPYLVDAPNIIVKSRTTPLCNVPRMIYGNKPVDGGHLIIEENEYEEFIKKEPKAKKFIKKLIGAQELLYNKDRYVLWLVDATPQEIQSMPLVYDRVQKVRKTRLNSIDPGARKLAAIPSLFREQNNPKQAMVIPRVTSDQREYIPIDFMSHTTIATDLLHCLPDCPLYIFAILNSQVHNAWMRVVTGRFGNGYRYSINVVYNNFPFPELTEAQKQKLNELGQNILDARAKYPDSTLAALYDPNTMPLPLLKAHQKLDKEVAKIYNKNWDLDNEAQIVSDLMQMYQQLLITDNKNTETTETEDEKIEDEETTEDDGNMETTDNNNLETTEHTELEYTDNMEITDKKQSKKTKTRKSKKQTTEHTETEYTDNMENTDKKESTKTKTRKSKKQTTENTEIDHKEPENKQKKAKTRKTKKTDNNETETETETETEIYASIPMTSKRTIKKVVTKATKATIKSTTIKKREKKVAKSKTTIKATKTTTSKTKKATIQKTMKIKKVVEEMLKNLDASAE
ncbi:MAG TPA: hypothetical protein P5543_06995, partial [Planctomycetota bacterium]|nr:hypothetical protein [Planctomycetota bacterium]